MGLVAPRQLLLDGVERDEAPWGHEKGDTTTTTTTTTNTNNTNNNSNNNSNKRG